MVKQLEFNDYRKPSRGDELKEMGMKSVMDNEYESWKTNIIHILEELCIIGKPFTSDNVRLLASHYSIGSPRHPNSWGAVFNSFARKSKRIKKSGRYIKSLIPSNHSAVIAEWEVIN